VIDIFTRRLDVYADLAYIQTIGTEETDMADYTVTLSAEELQAVIDFNSDMHEKALDSLEMVEAEQRRKRIGELRRTLRFHAGRAA